MKGMLAPGPVVNFNNTERGLSTVSFLPKKTTEITDQKQDKEAQEELRGTRTLHKALIIKKKSKKLPPSSFHHMIVLLGTYTMAIKR